MTRKRPKKPKKQRSAKLNISESEEINPDQLPPTFSLRHISNDYDISKLDKDEKAAFANTLHKLSKFTWSELKAKPRQKLGFEKIKRKSINVGIPNSITEDVNFISFRFSGMKPMIGYRTKDVYCLSG